MKQTIYDILKGKFLIADDAMKNWRMLLFLSFLAIIMIASSHNAESKVHEIARLNNEVRELRTHFVDGKTELMRLKMESSIIKKMTQKGLKRPERPPRKIIVKK
ncbi:ABC-type transport system involved in cytochrome bd biosynthesis fused ATPase/permease subunit [Aquimarina sp. EL_43]|uniref:S-adenosyl-methyltransferase n=1 Tax=Aquimarina atlantica TaxID=1317122 RepID=A0A023BY82_9FLAO|nr:MULTISPECIES: FtsL-like putative cell division protein [Aquimarina]EZH74588.1 S-adenosyl-methyltransferase [Aquimarina atlantica]MBG6131327.1 ABC-type transport system involved in cytochrome bd biosynthesis fused ATPase/permease subunit [Aquimarina sp. EL_35]MBG6151790.1 ABC-type transport system involved in cytochrome bd biosynthesis fused ATPase/permease subunit [Aquimarina sp. EL_32]MBG6169720.1 ABC-type transport system involved in cytochrome bd biosynthesis fused ATPase/permease subunit